MPGEDVHERKCVLLITTYISLGYLLTDLYSPLALIQFRKSHTECNRQAYSGRRNYESEQLPRANGNRTQLTSEVIKQLITAIAERCTWFQKCKKLHSEKMKLKALCFVYLFFVFCDSDLENCIYPLLRRRTCVQLRLQQQNTAISGDAGFFTETG